MLTYRTKLTPKNKKHNIMAYGLSNYGKEEIMDTYFKGDETAPASFSVVLYNDTTDALADTDTDSTTAITSQPTGAAYAAQSVNLDATDMTGAMNGSYYEITLKDLTFDVSDSTETVDSFALLDGTSIFGRGALDSSRALSGENGSITYTQMKIKID